MYNIGNMFNKRETVVNGYFKVLVLFNSFDRLLTQMDNDDDWYFTAPFVHMLG